MMKVPDNVYVLGHSYTCYTYLCYAYHFYAYQLYFINVWHVYEWPKPYTWSGTFILKDGRCTFTWRHEMCGACAVMCGASVVTKVIRNKPRLRHTHVKTKHSSLMNCWLRHGAKRRKVAGSIPDGVIAIFHWHNLSGRTMALGLSQPLTEMSTRNIFWG
jgi:hypothetical protein